jgi:2-polyprenyl-6-methoxyphenol hydroxylase-like FAD-dependent oxidoreductase
VNDVDVLIAGAGPVGLFLAGELARRGHACAIVERNETPSTHSKALAIMPRTLELFERARLCDAFLSEVNRVHGVRFVTPRGAAYVPFKNLPTAYPFVSILPQWKTEALLAARLRSAGVNILYGHELLTFEQSETSVHAEVRSSTGQYELRARYLVGCDGVHSTVREQARITFSGRSYAEEALLADIPIETTVPPDEARVYIDRGSTVTLFPMSACMRRIVVIAPRQQLPEMASQAWVQGRVEQAGMRGTVVGEPVWSSAFHVHRRVASRMRSGRVFLAGDAAHAHSPVGGQGMNVGFEDAAALAAVLSTVLQNAAALATLDRYEASRLPAARAVVRGTDFLLRVLAHPNRVMCVGRELLAPYVIRIPSLRNRVVRRLLTA